MFTFFFVGGKGGRDASLVSSLNHDIQSKIANKIGGLPDL